MCLMDSVEFLILKNLLHNEEYLRKVVPFIKADYFEDLTQKIGTLLSILLKKNSAISTEQDETTENTQSLSKIA